MWEALIQECAPTVHPQTMAAVIRAESANNPLAMNWISGGKKSIMWFVDKDKATIFLTEKLAQGEKLAVGLGQIHTDNFKKYGLTPSTAFDPCSNIRAGGKELTWTYREALKMTDDPNEALDFAFASYNAGIGRVRQYNGVPPFKETIKYIAHIRKIAGKSNGSASIGNRQQKEALSASTIVGVSEKYQQMIKSRRK